MTCSQALDNSSTEQLPEEPPSYGLRQIVAETLGELLRTILPALLLAMLLTHFVAQGTVVYGQSMEPNLHDSQRLIIEKISLHLNLPARGDIVVIDLDHSEIPLIKRVIGLPGELVEIRNGQVLIDGAFLEEPYLPPVRPQDYGPIQVPADHVFVLGDNRGASNDSRFFGPVALERIIGRACFSYWPPEYFGQVR
ncbi:MAG: signal peptidase I [Chloroflexia bacterium]|nr:signal peptidase I [Chloroflexia bacterium]